MSRLPPTPAREGGVNAGRLLLGLAIGVLGVLWLLQALDVTTIDWDIVLPIAVIAVGAALLIAGLAGRGSGGLVALGIALTVLLVASTVVHIPLGAGIGDRTYRPIVTQARTFELAIGKLTIDLTRPSLEAPTPSHASITAHVGIGQLVVLVPRRAEVEVRARAAVGSLLVFGQDRGGFDVEYRTPASDESSGILLDVSVGIGQVEVDRA